MAEILLMKSLSPSLKCLHKLHYLREYIFVSFCSKPVTEVCLFNIFISSFTNPSMFTSTPTRLYLYVCRYLFLSMCIYLLSNVYVHVYVCNMYSCELSHKPQKKIMQLPFFYFRRERPI